MECERARAKNVAIHWRLHQIVQMVFHTHIQCVWHGTVWQHVDVFAKFSDMEKGAYKSTKWIYVRERMDHFNGHYVCMEVIRLDKENCHRNSTPFIIISKVNQNNRHWLAFSLTHLLLLLLSLAAQVVVSTIHISNWNSGVWMRFPIVHRFLTLAELGLHSNWSKWASANTCRKLK